jgi:hypothetical protein
MATIQGLFIKAALFTTLAFCVRDATAQNVMNLRIDTVTATPGATVDVRVLYTFASTHAHNIHDFNARFFFDTSKSNLVAYIMAGTASAALFDTTGSHTGLLALGDQEIDLSDSVLFKIRMKIDSNADTAWIRWDPNWIVFGAGDEGVDTVHQQDGWIRTPKSNNAGVSTIESSATDASIYPNPARDHVTIYAPEYSSDAMVRIVDMAGEVAWSGRLYSGVWNIPQGLPLGTYGVILNETGLDSKCIGTVLIEPR